MAHLMTISTLLDDTRKQLATEKIAARLASLLERLSLWSYRLSLLKNGQSRLDAVQLPILRSLSRVAEYGKKRKKDLTVNNDTLNVDDAREWLFGIKYFEPLAAGGYKELQEPNVDDYVDTLSRIVQNIRVYSSRGPHLR